MPLALAIPHYRHPTSTRYSHGHISAFGYIAGSILIVAVLVGIYFFIRWVRRSPSPAPVDGTSTTSWGEPGPANPPG